MGRIERAVKAIWSRARDRPSDGSERTLSLTRPRTTSAAQAEMSSNEMIYSAVTRIGNALGTMPCRLYRGDVLMADDPLDRLLSLRPNRTMSAIDFKRAMEGYRNIEGRAYAAKRFDETGQLRELVVLDPRQVTPLISEETGETWYQVQLDDGRMEYLHNWYIIALHHMSTNGLSAIRVIDVLRGPIQYAQDVRSFSLESVRSINSGIVMDFPGTMGHDQRARAVKDFVELYKESGGQVLALESGVKASMLTGSAIDPDAFDVEQVTRARIASVYSMSPYFLGDYAAGQGKTPEQLTLEFLSFTMQHIVTIWEEELDYKLLTPQMRSQGYAWRFDIEAALRADSATLANLRQSQIRSGSRTPNEIRRKDHLPPVEGGDMAYLSKDLAPMHLVARGDTLNANEIAGEQNARKDK